MLRLIVLIISFLIFNTYAQQVYEFNSSNLKSGHVDVVFSKYDSGTLENADKALISAIHIAERTGYLDGVCGGYERLIICCIQSF